MLENRLFTIFPIYQNLSEQNRFKQGYSGRINDAATEILICPKERMLPFQYRKPSTANELTDIQIIGINATLGVSILPDIPAGDLDYETADGYTYITYFGNADLNVPLDCGVFYLKLVDADGTWYSEVFMVQDWTADETEYAETQDGNKLIVSSGTYLIWK